MLVVRDIGFMTEPIRFGAFGWHLKEADAVVDLVDCSVLAVTEVAEVEILFFLLSVDFFWAENRCYNAAFRWKKIMNTLYIS